MKQIILNGHHNNTSLALPRSVTKYKKSARMVQKKIG